MNFGLIHLYLNTEKEIIFFLKITTTKKKIAKISCGIVSKNKITDVGDALVRDYHLSFPFIFSQKNQIFMIPETMSNNRLEIYKCQKFPNKWDLFATAFDGENVVDPVIFTDKNKKMWLFLNKKWRKWLLQLRFIHLPSRLH